MPRAAEVAARLLAEFGSFPQVLSGSAHRLRKASGDGRAVAAIKRFRGAMLGALRAKLDDRPVLSNWAALVAYLHADMAYATTERVRVLHLNTRNILIHDDIVSEGSIDQAQVHVREVIARAIELGSAAIIIVHNHPSGDPTPSRGDVEITRAIIDAGKTVGVAVHDHIVVGAQGQVSLRARGLI